MTMNGLRTLLAGRGLVESPRWHAGRLYFSDWSAGEVLAVDLDGRCEVAARVKSLPLCTDWLPDGTLVIVSSQEGLLLRVAADGSLVTQANLGRPRRGRRGGAANGATGPRRLRLRPRRPGPHHPVHHGRPVARHDRRPDGGPGQRPGPRHRRRRPRRGLALTP